MAEIHMIRKVDTSCKCPVHAEIERYIRVTESVEHVDPLAVFIGVRNAVVFVVVAGLLLWGAAVLIGGFRG